LKKVEDVLAEFDEIDLSDDPLQTDNFFANSSLFLFHIDSWLRRFCLELVEPIDDVVDVIDRRDEFHEQQREQLLRNK
jgi:hypothetical protein